MPNSMAKSALGSVKQVRPGMVQLPPAMPASVGIYVSVRSCRKQVLAAAEPAKHIQLREAAAVWHPAISAKTLS